MTNLKAIVPLQRAMFYKKIDTFLKSNLPSEYDVMENF